MISKLTRWTSMVLKLTDEVAPHDVKADEVDLYDVTADEVDLYGVKAD